MPTCALDGGSSLHIVLALLLVKLSLLFSSCILILLVLGNEIVHVAFSLGEFHLVHTLAGVPMQEGLTAEHGCEELGHTFEHLLNRSAVAGEGNCHLQALRRNITDACL